MTVLHTEVLQDWDEPLLKREQVTITIHPGIRGGEPCITGTRIPVQMVAEYVETYGAASFLENWDYLTMDHVMLALWYTANFRKRIWRKQERATWLWDSVWQRAKVGNVGKEASA